MKLTDKEVKMLQNIAWNDFMDGVFEADNPVWSNCLDQGPNGAFTNAASFGGIVVSLVKKGLVDSDGDGKDGCVWLTEAGLEMARQVGRPALPTYQDNTSHSFPDTLETTQIGDRQMLNLIHHATRKKADALGLTLTQDPRGKGEVTVTDHNGSVLAIGNSGKTALDAAIRAMAEQDGMSQDVRESPEEDTSTVAEDVEPEDDEDTSRYGSVVGEGYRAAYAEFDQTCGDDVADALRVETTAPGKRITLDLVALEKIAKDNGVDTSNWGGLNNGMKRMNLSNVLRRMIRQGEVVKVGNQTWDLQSALRGAVKDVELPDDGELPITVISNALATVGLPETKTNINAVRNLWKKLRKVKEEMGGE